MRLLVTGAAGMLGQRVVADARGARLGGRRHRPGRRRPHRSSAGRRRSCRARAPTRSSTARPSPTSTAPRSARTWRLAVNRDASANVAAAAAAVGARVVAVSTDYVFDGVDGRAVRRVRPDRPARRLRPHEARRRERASPQAAPTTRSPARRGCSAPAARTSCDTMLAAGGDRDERRGGDRSGRLARRGPATSRRRCWTSPSATRPRRLPHRRRRAVLVARADASSCSPGRRRRRGRRDHRRRVRRAPRRGRRGACWPPSVPRPRACPPWREGVGGFLSERNATRMKLLVCGGAGFIGSNFVRQRVARPRRRGRRARQAHVRRPAREPRRPRRRARPRRDRGRRRGRPQAIAGRRCDRQLRRRDARRPLDRGPDAFVDDQRRWAR